MTASDRVTLGEFSSALQTVADLLKTGDTTGIEGGDPQLIGLWTDGASLQLTLGQNEGGFVESKGLDHISSALRFAGERVNSTRNLFIDGVGTETAVIEAEQLAHTLAEGYHTLSGSPGYKFKEG